MAEVVKTWDETPIVRAWDDSAPPGSRVEQIPDNVVPPTPDKRTGFVDKLKGAGEAALSMASSVPAQLVGNAAGFVRSVQTGDFGSYHAARKGEERAREVADQFTYQPRTEAGRSATRAVGEAVDASKLGGLNPFDAVGLARGVAPAARQARAAVPPLRRAGAADDMVGVGAAETEPARIRRERAADLPVPINLTKGQAERTFEQQRFERETAKAPVGGRLRERFADQNERILQNFDAWVDQIGAEAPDLRATGQRVNDAIVLKAARAKARVNAAYDEARAAGEMAQKVPTQALVDYIENNRPEAINAPVLASLEQKVIQLGGAAKDEAGKLVSREISINDLEEIRKMVGRVSDTTPTNLAFGKDAKKVIDALTEGAGGDVYKRARRLRTEYAREFENHAIVEKLLAKKPGTTDRAVAFEDVFQHSIRSGSLDDVRVLRGTLQNAGEVGRQAWRELQGQTVNYLKDEATKSATTDVRGNRIVSAAKLDRAVRNLDADGKLDFIFGKQGAQKVRDISELAADVYTSPPGAVNTSNTGSVVLEALSNMAVGKLPTAAAKGIGLVKSELGKRKFKKQIDEALSQGDVDRAGLGR